MNSVLAVATPVLDDAELLRRLESRREISVMMGGTGACVPLNSRVLFDEEDEDHITQQLPLEEEEVNAELSTLLSKLSEGVMEDGSTFAMDFDLEDIFVSSTSASRPSRGVTAEHLSKMWRRRLV